jgi:hypothetical protein
LLRELDDEAIAPTEKCPPEVRFCQVDEKGHQDGDDWGRSAQGDPLSYRDRSTRARAVQTH